MMLRNLSNYFVDNNDVVCASTGETVQPISGQYKLTTDELIDLPITGKQIYLVRRFTMDQLLKLIEPDKPNVTSGTSSKNGTNKVGQTVNVPEMGQDLEPNGTISGYSIQGVVYATIREASEATGIARNTLNRWIQAGKEGYSKV